MLSSKLGEFGMVLSVAGKKNMGNVPTKTLQSSATKICAWGK